MHETNTEVQRRVVHQSKLVALMLQRHGAAAPAVVQLCQLVLAAAAHFKGQKPACRPPRSLPRLLVPLNDVGLAETLGVLDVSFMNARHSPRLSL